jgi:hypothetical protein
MIKPLFGGSPQMSEHEVLALDSNFETWKRERASGITV